MYLNSNLNRRGTGYESNYLDIWRANKHNYGTWFAMLLRAWAIRHLDRTSSSGEISTAVERFVMEISTEKISTEHWHTQGVYALENMKVSDISWHLWLIAKELLQKERKNYESVHPPCEIQSIPQECTFLDKTSILSIGFVAYLQIIHSFVFSFFFFSESGPGTFSHIEPINHFATGLLQI